MTKNHFFLFKVPYQVQTLKREYFNRWYRFPPYYFAITFAKFPVQFLTSVLYLTMVYFITDQPVEWKRMLIFYVIALLTSMTSESFGLLVSSRLSILVRSFENSFDFFYSKLDICRMECSLDL